MSRGNAYLLIIMFLSSLGMSIFFPHLVSLLQLDFLLDPNAIGQMMMFGVILGNIVALIISLKLPQQYKKNLFIISFIFFFTSVFGFFKLTQVDLNLNIGTITLNSIMLSINISNISIELTYIVFILTGLIALYRFSNSIYFNSSRACQVMMLPQKEPGLIENNNRFKLFSYIRVINNISNGVGPLFGDLLLKKGGVDLLLEIAMVLFFIAFLMSFFVPVPVETKKELLTNNKKEVIKKGGLFSHTAYFYYLCLGAMCHSIFSSQLYAFIILKLNKIALSNSTGILFAVNSTGLTIIAFLIVRYLKIKNNNMFLWLILGSSCSCFAIISSSFVSNYFLLIVVAILFSCGESLTPQLTLNAITNDKNSVLAALAFYNFLTSAIGVGVGFRIGGKLASLESVWSASLSWISLLVLTITFFYLGLRERNSSKLPQI